MDGHVLERRPQLARDAYGTYIAFRKMRIGTALMWIGVGIVALGALVRFAPGLFSWFGNLPGDIRIEGESSRVFIPITSMIVVSVVATVIVNVVGSLLRER